MIRMKYSHPLLKPLCNTLYTYIHARECPPWKRSYQGFVLFFATVETILNFNYYEGLNVAYVPEWRWE